jgi:hypothetical protein
VSEYRGYGDWTGTYGGFASIARGAPSSPERLVLPKSAPVESYRIETMLILISSGALLVRLAIVLYPPVSEKWIYARPDPECPRASCRLIEWPFEARTAYYAFAPASMRRGSPAAWGSYGSPRQRNRRPRNRAVQYRVDVDSLLAPTPPERPAPRWLRTSRRRVLYFLRGAGRRLNTA